MKKIVILFILFQIGCATQNHDTKNQNGKRKPAQSIYGSADAEREYIRLLKKYEGGSACSSKEVNGNWVLDAWAQETEAPFSGSGAYSSGTDPETIETLTKSDSQNRDYVFVKKRAGSDEPVLYPIFEKQRTCYFEQFGYCRIVDQNQLICAEDLSSRRFAFKTPVRKLRLFNKK